MPKVPCLRALWAFRVRICRGRRHRWMPKLSLPSQGSAPALFKPFNDCPLSLKGGANLEGETASETEKRLKKRKNKTAESRERLISTHFCDFPLYQFRGCFETYSVIILASQIFGYYLCRSIIIRMILHFIINWHCNFFHKTF